MNIDEIFGDKIAKAKIDLAEEKPISTQERIDLYKDFLTNNGFTVEKYKKPIVEKPFQDQYLSSSRVADTYTISCQIEAPNYVGDSEFEECIHKDIAYQVAKELLDKKLVNIRKQSNHDGSMMDRFTASVTVEMPRIPRAFPSSPRSFYATHQAGHVLKSSAWTGINET